MTIATGDPIPDVKVFTFGESGPQATTSGELLGTGKVVLFAVPGAFTPTCSDHHLPGFVLRTDEIKAPWASRWTEAAWDWAPARSVTPPSLRTAS